MQPLVATAAAAVIGIAALASSATASPIDFAYTGSLVDFTVPTTDTYQIVAYGAQGGNGSSGVSGEGGLGAEIGGDFSLSAGEILQIAVGGAGSGTGGGGGSFVIGPNNMPLVIAGGGGAGGLVLAITPNEPIPGGGGLTGPDGGPGSLVNGGAPGGTNGNGGSGGNRPNGASGGGGGGFYTAGGNGLPFGATGGAAFPDLAGGLGGGGFGGGGGGSVAGGGGGGYSGGGGGVNSPGAEGGGGGGGSFDTGLDQILMADFWSGNGEVVITDLTGGPPNSSPVPEPGSLALLGTALLAGFGALY